MSDDGLEIDLAELTYEDVTEVAPDGRAGMLGRYQLCFELASGGMGKVYLARIEGAGGFEKVFALKRIHAHLAEEREFVEMFLDEARLASRIDHPNVCTVFDFGGSGREYYIAMEYLLGETVSKVWKRISEFPDLGKNRRWWAIAMRIVAEACEGLHAAHELTNDAGDPLHVVHRDVSPWNLFVSYDGGVKVMDFGVARAAERIHQTRTGQVKGHYAYMAPEQARNADFDRRADVWSLGVILWELLTLKRLFDRPTEAATIMAVANGEIPPPSSLVPALPASLDAIVLRALAQNPNDRYATARDLGRELERAVAVMHQAVGKSEIAELMAAMFTTERARRQRILIDARTLEAGRVLRALEDELELEVQDVVGGTPTRIQMHPAPPINAPPMPTPIGAPVPAERSGRSSWGILVLGIVGGIALSGALFAGAFFFLDEKEAEPRATLPELEPPPAAIEPPAQPPRVAEVAPEPVAPAPTPSIDEAEEEPTDEGEETSDGPDERRERRPRVVHRAPGTVAVVTPGGWAEIYVRGRRVGRSPGRVELPSGPQTLTLRPFGTQPPRNVRVVVPAGGTARVSVPVRQ